MLQKLQNKPTAWLVTAIIITLAIYVGAYQSLHKAFGEAFGTFYAESADTTKGIHYDLQEIIADSNNLLTVAGGYLEADDIAMDEMRRSIKALENSVNISQKYAAAQQLRLAVKDLDGQLAAQPLDDKAKGYRSKLVTNIESHYRIIENSSYNAAATAFNQELKAFPANVLAPLVGVKPLELFA